MGQEKLHGITALISEESKSEQCVTFDVAWLVCDLAMDAKHLPALLEIELLDFKLLSLIRAVVILVSIGQLHLHGADSRLVRVHPDVPDRSILEDFLGLAVEAAIADEGHAAGRGRSHCSVDHVVVVLEAVLVDDHLLVAVVEPVHLQV